MQTDRPQLLVATSNPGKLSEFRALLRDIDLEIIGLNDLGPVVEVEETGSTFDENAAIKAEGYARQTHRVTLADDSGLEVAALDGRPGVFSARYGVPTFDQKMSMLLDELNNTGDEFRRARFVAALAMADQTGQIIHTAKGICRGKISTEQRGNRGFGYDPLFIPDGYDRTFGELHETIKRKISHRGRAFSEIMPFLRGFYAI